MTNNNSNWENFGDVNPLKHGGIFIKRDTEINPETCFYIVKNVYDCDGEKHIIYDLYVDITDSWIEKQDVMEFIGMTENDFDSIQYAIGCTDYYSMENFGGNRIECSTIEELQEELKKYEIEVE